ncbi:leucine-rich repeat and guanylate kinase domain-containing protein isoform X3 [Notolabrus celidotus]|uniref:leucine-rich repeat and guanylate kinase domain-containing protein isoform X3 n=1 Tax=Notolabrus celidotus TaxID=1203425 RepID=UPI00149031B9|nr:leucine-rich repeat and guanylate kinase domain-containing protein isoform X3 [Notolabrus celidotus]
MKEATVQQLSPASPSCSPPGSLSDAASAQAPGCDEQEEHGDMEKEGVLTAEVVSSYISNLSRSSTGHHSYHYLSLPKHNLSDISVLCNYVYLQKLELQHNKIKDLSCVSHMPYLVILDASHNEIPNFFGFQPPKNLKEVNFSHNRMTKMKDLSAYSSLSKLDLDYNLFSEIVGLEQCCKLTNLSLAHNKISRISGLDTLPLTHLCLRENQLETIEGLESQKSLQVLDLSVNRITSLSGLQNLHLLGSINVEKNLISEIQECKHLHDLFLLRDLNLLGNPVQEQPDYRLAVVFLLQHLTLLDQEKVTVEEKVYSVNKYDPPLEVVAARDHMTHLVYQLMQPQVLYDRTCHTTRGPYFGEENEIDYHFVSEEEFQKMVHMGKFIQTVQYGGHRYGLTRDAIEDVAGEGLACCVHMELEGVFSLKNSYFEPRYILFIPTKVEKYMDQLKGRNLYSQEQIDNAVARIELYANTNRQRPGFFDNVIPSDDYEEAFQSLKRIVKDYLLLDEQEEEENNRGSPDNTSVGHMPEQKPSSPLSRSRSGTLTSHSATALEPSNSSYRNYFTKIQAELSPEKSPAELASIRRREQLVREAIAGKSPEVYSQLFKSSAQIAPSSQQNQDAGIHLSEDSSSSEESRASSALSVPSSAGALSGIVEPLDISVLGQALETPKGPTPENPTNSEQQASVLSPYSDRRPGSNVKAVLPPIPTGRKTPTASSVAPSPSPSPRPSPNPTVEEKGEEEEENREG